MILIITKTDNNEYYKVQICTTKNEAEFIAEITYYTYFKIFFKYAFSYKFIYIYPIQHFFIFISYYIEK